MEDDNRKVMAAAVVLAAVVGAGYYAWKSSRAPAAGVSSAPAAPAAPSAPGLPKLEDSDEAVRAAAAGLAGGEAWASWLKQDSLIQRFVAIAARLSRGEVARDSLSAFAPRGKFPVVKKDGASWLDTRGYARYDAFAGAFASLDAVAAARLYERFEPLINEAWSGLGEKGGDARSALASGISELLAAPELKGDVKLKEGKKGIVYAYADESLEKRSAAQKQIMRMGPANEARVQSKLREFASALSLKL